MYGDDLQDKLLGTRGYRTLETPLMKLDEIEKQVVARLDMSHLIRKVRTQQEPWSPLLVRTLQPEPHTLQRDTPKDQRWCGLDLSPTPPRPTRARLIPIFDQVKDSLLEELPSAAGGATTSVLFLVPKSPTLARIVLDGRDLNGRCAKPPRLRFMTMAEIFRLIQFFPRPYVGTGDFRHWFYQIPLDEQIRHLFSLECGGRFFRQRAWAMGFAWSPFVAQGISMLLAKWGIERSAEEGGGKWFAVPSIDDENTPPPFWFVTDRDYSGVGEVRRGAIVGFVSFWYDNLLVIAKSARARERILRGIAEEARDMNALWKPAKGEGEQGPRRDEFTRTTNGASFMGLIFAHGREGWWWNHSPENRSDWASTTTPSPRSWRAAARLTGILTWDWLVSGTHRDAFADVFEITRAIGLSAGDRWEAPVPDRKGGGIPNQSWGDLEARLATLCAAERRQWPLFRADDFDNTRYLASDAMEVRGAGICLDTGRMLWLHHFDEEQLEAHINWKETHTAIHTTWAAAKDAAPRTMFRIAVDNTTAKVVLNAGCVPWDAQLDREVRELTEYLRERGSDFEAIYVPGVQQPADEPSRAEEVEPAKVQECRLLLQKVVHPWWRSVNM